MNKLDRIITESIDKVIKENKFKSPLSKIKAASYAAAKKEGGKSGEERYNDWRAKQAAIADLNRELHNKRSMPKKDRIPVGISKSFDDGTNDIGVFSADRMRDAKDYFNSENEFNGAINNDTFDNEWLIDRDIN
jgi:hypothetical protein